MSHLHRGLLASLGIFAAICHAEVVDVRQGTNLAVAYDPASETLALDLLGGLWRLPVTGGGAVALIPAGSGVAQPRFDPTGRRVVFQRWSEGQWDLWLLDSSSGTWAPLTETPYNEREPEFSADGRRVVFSSDRTGRYSIWELDLADGALRQLTDEAGDGHFPTIDAAGEIVYVNHGTHSSALMRYAGRPQGTEILRGETTFDAPSWRPGGHVIVFNDRVPGRSSSLKLLIDADERVLVPLTDREDVFVGRVVWLSPAEYLYAADGQLWRRDIASTERRPVHLFAGASVNLAEPTPVRAALDAPGPHVARGIVGIDQAPGGQSQVFAALGDLWMRRRRELVQLTDDAYLDVEPRFVADGSAIVFASDRGGKMDLWRMDLDTHDARALTSERGNVLEPAVSPDGESVAFLSLDGEGPWTATTVKRIRLEPPGPSETLASGLYDAGGLSWDADAVRVTARRETPEAPPTEISLPIPAGEAPLRQEQVLQLPDEVVPTWSPAVPDAPYAVLVGRLFDGIGNEYARHMDIHVEGQRITAIVRRGRLPLPDRVIDAREKTVIPGLVDVHVHESAAAGGGLGRLWLRNGVTTVREVDADLATALERAESWASGRRPGPRVVIVPTDPPADLDVGEPIVLQSGSAVSQGFAHAAAYRDLRSEDGNPRLPALLRGSEAAGAADLALSPLNLSYQDTIGRLLASGRFVATGLVAARAAEAADPSPVTQALGDTLARLMRSSARIAIASDAPAVPYGQGFHEELAALARTGIPPAQILRWATAGGAMALGLDQQLGTLEVGKLADFVVIDGDPLTRIDDARRVELVVKGGVVFEGDDLAAGSGG